MKKNKKTVFNNQIIEGYEYKEEAKQKQKQLQEAANRQPSAQKLRIVEVHKETLEL